MNKLTYINSSVEELLDLGKAKHDSYVSNPPFPNIYFDDFFNTERLDEVLAEFPELGDKRDIQFNNPNENKLATRGEYKFQDKARAFAHFMNSQPFLEFLTNLTGIKGLIPDPYLEGGGFHQIKPGGYLKLHADFNKNRIMNVDRRLNVLVYLNKDWEESYGGHFELWDTEMKGCVQKILPTFNRMAIFSTTDFSYHGHPDPLTCPPDRSRKSMAFYYYTNGRPKEEVLPEGEDRINTIFRGRKGLDNPKVDRYNQFVQLAWELTPPIVVKMYKRMFR